MRNLIVTSSITVFSQLRYGYEECKW